MFLSDFGQSLELWRFWLYRATLVLKLKYNMTILGVLWEPVALIVVGGALSIIWSVVLEQRSLHYYFTYVITGLAVWNLLAAFIRSGVKIFMSRVRDITSTNHPLFVYILEDFSFHLLKFVLIFPILLFISIKSDALSITNLVMFLYAISLIVISGIGFTMTIGVLAFFFLDLRVIIESIMRLSFLLTPIIWQPERLGQYQEWVWLNPFYCYLEAARSSIISTSVNLQAFLYATVGSMVILGCSISLYGIVHKKLRYRAFQI